MLLLQRRAWLESRRIRCCCDGRRIPGRRGNAVSARRGERGKSGGSCRVGGFIAGEWMVALVAEAAVIEVVGVVGAGALGVRGVVMGKIIVDVGAVKRALDAILVTTERGSAGCGKGFKTFFHALSREIRFLDQNFWIMLE